VNTQYLNFSWFRLTLEMNSNTERYLAHRPSLSRFWALLLGIRQNCSLPSIVHLCRTHDSAPPPFALLDGGRPYPLLSSTAAAPPPPLPFPLPLLSPAALPSPPLSYPPSLKSAHQTIYQRWRSSIHRNQPQSSGGRAPIGATEAQFGDSWVHHCSTRSICWWLLPPYWY
jgi:hypothetical protein